MKTCRRRSQRQYKLPVEKIDFKILQYHEIKREEGPKKDDLRTCNVLLMKAKRASILLLWKKKPKKLKRQA